MKRSIWQLVNTLIPFFGLWYLAYLSMSVSYGITIVLAVVAAGFFIKIFIIFHDCCHQSFFGSRGANAIVGTITGILTYIPYNHWRYTHSVHHASSGNLNRRGVGDIWTLTVDEYLERSPIQRFFYRVYRNPFVLFGFGPIYTFLVEYRFNRKKAGLKERMNTYITNTSILALTMFFCWLIGWKQFLLVQGPIFFLAGIVGIWLFYVQHQFEESYFEYEQEWDYVKAAMQGSSFYNLPRVLHWITGNIGYHHIHHLSPKVPNYALHKAHIDNPILQKVKAVSLTSSLCALRYRVWSNQKKGFVSFKEMKKIQIK